MKDHIHIPVLLFESVESLDLSEGETVVDCTVNRASHSEEFANKVGKSGKIIIFDLDKKALEFSVSRLKKLTNSPEIISIHSNYRNLKQELKKNKIEKVDKVFADLGLSSEELELSGRGFSFQKDEPLIMTFQSEVNKNTLTAKDLLYNLNKDELAGIFKNYGEETRAKKIAETIILHIKNGGKLETTKDLVDLILSIIPYKPWQKTHPATKVFQALRIAVNDEYDGIRELIHQAFEIIRVGGRISIISFHSGEDRIVKNLFNEFKQKGLAKLLTKQKPSETEIRNNRRSRSAILRTLEKI